MDCQLYREAFSASLDGAASPLEVEGVEAHLRLCPGCRGWAEQAARVTRLSRVGPADEVPDLTARIMAALPPAPRGPASARARRPAPSSAVPRVALLLVALAQLAIAVPDLLGNDAGAPVHIAREQGSWALALAFGFLLAAWRPVRAGGLLPVVGVLVGCLAVTTTFDVLAGRTVASGEAPHVLTLLGLALLWVLAHPGGPVQHRVRATGAAPA